MQSVLDETFPENILEINLHKIFALVGSMTTPDFNTFIL